MVAPVKKYVINVMGKEKPGAIDVMVMVLLVMVESVYIVMQGMKNVPDATVELG